MAADVEDKFYKNSEFKALSPAQKKKLTWLRKQRGGSSKGKKSCKQRKTSSTSDAQISALATTVTEMTKALGTVTKAVAKLQKQKTSSKSGGNRSHPALTPVKQKKKSVSFDGEVSSPHLKTVADSIYQLSPQAGLLLFCQKVRMAG